MGKTSDLYIEGKHLIPGGSLYSKRPELYSSDWPPYFSKARGVVVTDLDDCTYIDMSFMALGACTLGYSDEDVDLAVIRGMAAGSTSSLSSPEEVEIATLLIELHSWAQMARFARSGGEAITIALRIAQTYTHKQKVLYCGYHGWHISDPRTNKPVSTDYIPFQYNNIEQLEFLALNTSNLAAIVMEPSRHEEPKPDYLNRVRAIAASVGAVLIFDEISSGFRAELGGLHLHYGVNPDVAVFAKAISNGYPMAAVIGTEKVMSAAQDTFISSTSWSERIGPTAALATINKLWAVDCGAYVKDIGKYVQDMWRYVAKVVGLDIVVSGPPVLSHMELGSQELNTLYTQLMLEEGFLANKDFYPSYAHKEEHLEDYLSALNRVFPIIQDAKEKGIVADLLHGPAAQKGLARLT